LLKAVATNCRSNCPEANDDIELLAISEFEGSAESRKGIEATKRIQDLMDGLALLYFNTCKGVKGCLHSKGGAKLSIVLDLLMPLPSNIFDSIASGSKDSLEKEKLNSNKKGKGAFTTVAAISKNKSPLTLAPEALSKENKELVFALTAQDSWVTYTLTQV
jgi:hypothetical protein